MAPEYTKLHFEKTDDGELFFPWVMWMSAGVPWAFVVPTDACRERLTQLVRHYWLASWAILAIGLCLGIPLGQGKLAILLSIAVPLPFYSVVALLHLRGLRRLPVAESLRCYTAKVGQEALWKQVFLVGFCLVLQVWLRMTSFAALVCLGYLFLNGVMAVCALSGR